MEIRVNVTIMSKSRIEGQESVSEFFTDAIFKYEDGRALLVYTDLESGGDVDQLTSVQIAPNQVAIRKLGVAPSYLLMEQGKRQLGFYETPGGVLEIGLFASVIDANFNESGGRLRLCYKLDANAQLISENELYIKVEPLPNPEEDGFFDEEAEKEEEDPSFTISL
ncbi:MAG: DUF1934 domain-containing protein [Oscillospiraceae bacterium]|jgi:uncharacterized beta-barrel protein YwiB (DUF1934 family)|nr:DUF1934 domain-containing protein [Oscillospiraceae bacterium]